MYIEPSSRALSKSESIAYISIRSRKIGVYDSILMEQRSIICSCKSDRVITDHESGEVICINCGLVISDNMQESLAEGCASFTTDAIYDMNRNTGPPYF